jgi:hypothetical protein
MERLKTWIANEIKGIELKDKRRNKRCKRVIKAISENPSGSIAQTCKDWVRAKGAYRFLDNTHVTREGLLKPHIENTAERIREREEVAVIQDTTTIVVKQKDADGFGPIGRSKYRLKGLIVHTTLAVDVIRDETLGVISQEAWVRDGYYDQAESSRWRRDRPRESECWQRGIQEIKKMSLGRGTISIFDRGGDMYEVLAIHEQAGQRYVIRASQDRLLSDGATHLFEAVRKSDALGAFEVHVPGKGSRKERTALVSIRGKTLKIKPPKSLDRKGDELTINVVEAYEQHAPKGWDPLHWILLTNEAIWGFEECVRIVRLYTKRWKIEEFHKALKTGCRMEEHQFKTRKTLETFLGLASIISVMLLNLRDNARDAALTVHGLSDIQVKILRKQYPCIGKQPKARDVLRAVAQLGGFLGRKSDGNPGWITLWRGMRELMLLEQGYLLSKFASNLTSISPKLVGTV